MQRYYFFIIYTNPQTYTTRTLIPTLSFARTRTRASRASWFSDSSSVPFSILKYRKDFEARRTGFHFFEIFRDYNTSPKFTYFTMEKLLSDSTDFVLNPDFPFHTPKFSLILPSILQFSPNFPFKTLFPPYLTNYTTNTGSYSPNSPKYLYARVYARTRIMRARARVMIFWILNPIIVP